MARPVAYPDSIEPLVQFVEETTPEHIVAHTRDKLAGGTVYAHAAEALHFKGSPA